MFELSMCVRVLASALELQGSAVEASALPFSSFALVSFHLVLYLRTWSKSVITMS